MHAEQTPVASSASSTTTPTNSTTAITNTITTNTIITTNNTIATSGAGRHILPRISVYSGITDRQTVQVLQQALNGQPGTAAQYLQQMYVAQQQHLMLQTAALNTTQLQSLGTMQKGTLVAGHPTSNQNSSPVLQTGNTQTIINLTVPVTAAQLISRSQSVSTATNSVPQTAVILRNASNPVLTASQAQMYLRAQMLFLTPTAAITATKEALTQSTTQQQQQTSGAQVQNLSICRIQGPTPSAPTTSCTTPCAAASAVQLHGLCLKQTSGCNQFTMPVPGQEKVSEEKEGPGPDDDAPSDIQKREGQVEVRGLMSVSQSLTTLTQHPLIRPDRTRTLPGANPSTVDANACAQIQMQAQLQQHKQQNTGIHEQHAPQHSQVTLLHTHTRAQMVQTLAIQPRVQPQARQDPAVQPVLPKPPVSSLPAAIFHSIVRPTSQVLSPSESTQDQNPHRPTSDQSQEAQPCAKPLQQAAVDFQSQLTAESPNNTIPDAQQIMPLPVQEAPNTTKQEPANSDMSAYKTEDALCIHAPIDTSDFTMAASTPVLPSSGRSNLSLIPQCTLSCTATPDCVTNKEAGEESAGCCGLNVNLPGGSAPVMTSGNGNNAPTVTGSTPQNGESKPPPQAIVKPHILTHLIGGFVIQEGAEPFPVERPSFSIESLRKHKHYSERHNHNSEMEDLSSQELKKQQDEPMLTCELCGRVDFAYIFKGSKRFCSTVCAKRYNVGCSKRVGLFSNRRTAMENLKKQRTLNGTHRNSTSFESKKKVPPSHQKPVVGAVTAGHLALPAQGESSQCSDMPNYESPLSPLSAAAASAAQRVHPGRGPEHSELPLLSHSFLACDPAQWNVEDVYEFICSLPGCLEIAEEFRSQEIDGQALLLLKEDHLMGTMNIKLGPALKIFAQISMLKDS